MAKWISFESIVDKAKEKGIYEKNAMASLAWFRRNAKRMFGATPEKLVRSEELKSVSRTLSGQMYMYGYDPKLKETLPYYDTFPLIIMVGPAKGGFYGINLHYLDLRRRAKLFDGLMTRRLKESPDGELARFLISYRNLSNAGGNVKFFVPCWKHYLTKKIGTNIVNVPSKYWESALFLPTERFQKKPKQRVWRESKKIISRR